MAQAIVAVTSRQTAAEGHVVFRIDVQQGGQSWTVWRRYNEFEELSKKVACPVPLPPKSFFRKAFSPGFMDDRQRNLHFFLCTLVQNDPNLTNPGLQQFLQESAYRPPHAVASQPIYAQKQPAYAHAQPVAQAQQIAQGLQPYTAQAVQPQACQAVALPVASAPAPTVPAQAMPMQSQPVASAPAPTALAPAQAMHMQCQPVQAMPAQAQPVQAMPLQAQPVQAMPLQTQQPVQAMPLQAQPAQAISCQRAAAVAYAQHAQPAHVQPSYMQPPIQPHYAQPGYAMPTYGQSAYTSQQTYGQNQNNGHKIGMGVAAAGGAAALLGGILIGEAIEHRSEEFEYEREQRRWGMDYDDRVRRDVFPSGFFGSEEVRTEVTRDAFGDTEVRREVFDRDMFGDVTEVRAETIDRDMFGNVTEDVYVEDRFW